MLRKHIFTLLLLLQEQQHTVMNERVVLQWPR